MTYHDQPYYKEFRDLLTRIQAGVNDLKEENQRLKEDNNAFSSQLKEVRGKLADAQREVDRLRKQPETGAAQKAAGKNSGAASGPSGGPLPTLFGTFDEKERRILRQQIIDLIARIDKHLAQSGAPAQPDT